MITNGKKLLRYVCEGCDNMFCVFHSEGYKYTGTPQYCLYSSDPGHWHPQVMIEEEWIRCKEESIGVLFFKEIQDAIQ